MKKSARQIYAEAFMDEDNMFTRTNTRDYADDALLKEEFENRKSKKAAEGEEIDGDATTSNKASETSTEDAEDDPLDKLTRTEEEL
jgi:hypothetical protein